MAETLKQDLEQLVKILDARIDDLTKPIPSKQLRRFAEAIRSAEPGAHEAPSDYTTKDYSNLLEVKIIVSELLPAILEKTRAHSIDPKKGWRLKQVDAEHGDYGLCAICEKPYQHFGQTVEVHCFDMHARSFAGVCRPCVRGYAPLTFSEREDVVSWLYNNRERRGRPKDRTAASGFNRRRARTCILDALLWRHCPISPMPAASRAEPMAIAMKAAIGDCERPQGMQIINTVRRCDAPVKMTADNTG